MPSVAGRRQTAILDKAVLVSDRLEGLPRRPSSALLLSRHGIGPRRVETLGLSFENEFQVSALLRLVLHGATFKSPAFSFSRLRRMPACSRSQVSFVMPSDRSTCFSIFCVGVFGRSSMKRI